MKTNRVPVGHRDWSAPPASQTRWAVASYGGSRNRRPPTGPVWLDAVGQKMCQGCHLTTNNVAASAYQTCARGRFSINFRPTEQPATATRCAVIPEQAGSQNVSRPTAVADLGSDPHSAQHLQTSPQRHTEWGSDPNSADHRKRSAPSAQPASQTRWAVASYGGSRNRRPPTGPVWLDAVGQKMCQGCQVAINTLATSAYQTCARGQLDINSCHTAHPAHHRFLGTSQVAINSRASSAYQSSARGQFVINFSVWGRV